MNIPDAAVEAAAHAMFEVTGEPDWTAMEIRQVVEAAAPHIAAQALRDAADEVRGYAYTPDDVREVAHGDDYADGITDAHHVFDRLLAARADRIEAEGSWDRREETLTGLLASIEEA